MMPFGCHLLDLRGMIGLYVYIQYDTYIIIYAKILYLANIRRYNIHVSLLTNHGVHDGRCGNKLHLYTHVKHRKSMVALGYSQFSDSCLNRAWDSCPTTAPTRPSTHRRHQRGYIEGLF